MFAVAAPPPPAAGERRLMRRLLRLQQQQQMQLHAGTGTGTATGTGTEQDVADLNALATQLHAVRQQLAASAALRLSSSSSPPLAAWILGAPLTGKSAVARALAARLGLVLITPRTLMLRLAGRGTAGNSNGSSGIGSNSGNDPIASHALSAASSLPSASLYNDDEDDEAARAAAAAAAQSGVWRHPDLWRLVPPPHTDAPYDEDGVDTKLTATAGTATAATGTGGDTAEPAAAAAAIDAASSLDALSPPLSTERRATWTALAIMVARRAPVPLPHAATGTATGTVGAKAVAAHQKVVAPADAAAKNADDEQVDSVCAALWIEPLAEWLASDEVRVIWPSVDLNDRNQDYWVEFCKYFLTQKREITSQVCFFPLLSFTRSLSLSLSIFLSFSLVC